LISSVHTVTSVRAFLLLYFAQSEERLFRSLKQITRWISIFSKIKVQLFTWEFMFHPLRENE